MVVSCNTKQKQGDTYYPKKGLKITKDPGNNDGRDGEKQHHEEENSSSNEGLLALLVNNHQDCSSSENIFIVVIKNIKQQIKVVPTHHV